MSDTLLATTLAPAGNQPVVRHGKYVEAGFAVVQDDTERNAMLASVLANGFVVWNVATAALQLWNGSAWVALPGASGGGGGGDGFSFTFSTSTADADPGAGEIAFNNATPSSVTVIFVDLADSVGNTITAWLDSLVVLGRIRIVSQTDKTRWAVYNLTGVTTATAYRKLQVTHVASSGTLPTTTSGDTFLSFDANPDLTPFVKVDGSRAFTGDQSFGGHKGTNAANGVASTDLVTKGQLDAAVQGLGIKPPCLVLYNTNVASLSGAPATTDGITPTTGSRVFLNAQTTATQNGPWVTASGAWTRPADFAAGSSAANAFFFIQEGTAFGDTGWVCASDPGSDVVGTNNLVFQQFSSAGVIVADETTLHKVGNTLSIKANGVGNTELRQGGACSVFGRSANSTGNVADIAFSADGTVLQRAGGVVSATQLDLTTHFASTVRVETGSALERGLQSYQASSDANSAHVLLKKSRGTSSAPTKVLAGDAVGHLVCELHNGTTFVEIGGIRYVAVVDGDVSVQPILQVRLHDGTAVRIVSQTMIDVVQTTTGGNTLFPRLVIPMAPSSRATFAVRIEGLIDPSDPLGASEIRYYLESIYAFRRVASGAPTAFGAPLIVFPATFDDPTLVGGSSPWAAPSFGPGTGGNANSIVGKAGGIPSGIVNWYTEVTWNSR